MKTIVKSVLALAMLSGVSQAAEKKVEDQGLYAGAGIGVMATDDNGDAGLGLSLRAGAALDKVLKGLGVQIELNKSLSDPERPNNRDIDVMTLGAYATFDIKIPDSRVTLRPKIGAICPNMNDDIDSRDFILSSGFGMTYAVESNVRLYADYTVLGESISNYSAGLEFKF